MEAWGLDEAAEWWRGKGKAHRSPQGSVEFEEGGSLEGLKQVHACWEFY